MRIFNLYQKYCDNVNIIDNLEALNSTSTECDEWLKSMEKRASLLHDTYIANNNILKEIEEYCNSDLSASKLNELFIDLTQLVIKCADSEIMIPMVERLAKEFDSSNEYGKAISVYLIGFMLFDQRDNYESDKIKAREYLERIIKISEHYSELDEVSQRKIFVAYHALACSCIDNTTESHNLSYKYFNDFRSFYELHKFDDNLDSEWKQEYMKFAIVDWLSISKAYYDLCDDAKRDVYVLALNLYKEELDRVKGNELDVLPQIYGSYLNVMAGTGELSYEDVVDKLFKYYTYNVEHLDSLCEKSNIILNIPIEILGHLKHVADRNKAIELFNTLDALVQSTWKSFFTNKTTTYVNNLFSCWVTNALYFIDDLQVQQKYIHNLLVKKEIPIYLHTMMVKNIADVIYLSVSAKKPELFGEIEEKDMRTYVNNAALLHDIGKVKISTAINQRDRRLSNGEFKDIRKHPSYGAELISDSKGLAKYTDVILYHHKYYDGTGGYPQDDGNTKSKYRVVIDIITIADCLDAATDYLGRNYRDCKTIDEVFAEFARFSGTKYNPDLVDIILNDDSLKNEIRNLTETYRKDLMYKVFINGVEGLD